MQSDVYLNSRLNVGGNVIHRRRFQMNDLENCSGCLCNTRIKRIALTLNLVRQKMETGHFNVIMVRKNMA